MSRGGRLLAARPVKILTISGSLRARSANTELLRAAQLVADRSWTFDHYDGLASLPHFNPDLDFEGATPLAWPRTPSSPHAFAPCWTL